jgi:hypothetical protein
MPRQIAICVKHLWSGNKGGKEQREEQNGSQPGWKEASHGLILIDTDKIPG